MRVTPRLFLAARVIADLLRVRATVPAAMRVRFTKRLDGHGLDRNVTVNAWLRRPRSGPPKLDRRVEFELNLGDFGEEWAAAIQQARKLATEPMRLGGVPVESALAERIELSFAEAATDTWYGTVSFVLVLSKEPAFPFEVGRVSPARADDVDFWDALAAANQNSGPIQVDEIDELKFYWVFPTRSIGPTGAIVDRRTGELIEMGSPLPASSWIWAHEHRLLGDGDLVVTDVRDEAQAWNALSRFVRLPPRDLKNLPLTLEGCANWRAVVHLEKAGYALTWHVA